MTKIVLFDLDDTLFDHLFAASSALKGLQSYLPRYADGPLEVLEEEYSRLLEEVHLRVLAGEIGLDEARRERVNLSMSSDGESVREEKPRRMAVRFR